MQADQSTQGSQQPERIIKVLIQLSRGGKSRVGPDRIRLLEVIGEQGSIAAAATIVGLSYKGAWDAVQALNSLFNLPLVAAQRGGRVGGAAAITPAGEAVILAFRKVEAELSDAIARLQEHLSSEPG